MPIEFTSGHTLDFACASGALAFDGRGWPWEWPFRWSGLLDPSQFTVVAKTVTLAPRAGNLKWRHPWTCFRLLPKGAAVNAIGLTNPGIDYWIQNQYPVAVRNKYKLAASVMATSQEEAAALGRKLRALKLSYVEVNVSCPNVKGESSIVEELSKQCEAIGEESRHPVVFKLSHEQSHNEELLRAVWSLPCVEAFHAINTVPWATVFGETPSPLEPYTGVKGGVSGPRIFRQFTLDAVEAVKRTCPDAKIIAGGGIASVQDCLEACERGADAFSIGTLFIRTPWKPNQVVAEYRRTQGGET